MITQLRAGVDPGSKKLQAAPGADSVHCEAIAAAHQVGLKAKDHRHTHLGQKAFSQGHKHFLQLAYSKQS